MARVSGDRPLLPRHHDDLEVVDLATIGTGEWDRVELVGVLPQGFDEPLLLTSARVKQASLVGARLANSRLVDVTVSSSDLSGVDLQGASFTRVEFCDVRLSGAQLAQTRWRDTRLVDCRLEAANVAMSVGDRVRFERCQMEEVEFHSANLEGVAWWDCDLTSAEFSQVTVSRAQLHGSTIDRLRGASALAPVGIDAEQFPAFAHLLLDAAGIVVSERDGT